MRRPFAALSVLAFVVAACQAASLRADEPKSKPTDARPRVTLTWSTASEVDNYGYFVMRGDDEKGPFKAVNEKVIPGASNSDMPRGYRYEDFDVAQGKTYWYYLESLSTAGVREKFSPVLKRQCCKVPGAATAAEPKREEKKDDKKEEARQQAPASAAKGDSKKR